MAQLTLLPMPEVRDVVTEHESAPERRLAQQRLADEVTGFVHGPEAAVRANLAAEALYGTAPLSGEMLGALAGIVVETRVGVGALAGPEALVGLLVASGLCSSRGDARRQLGQSAISVNRTRVAQSDVVPGWLIDGRFLLLQRGRRERRLVVVDA